MPDADHVLKVEVVEQAEDETKSHLDDTKDDGHLHLVRVGEDEEVVGSVPGDIDTDGVGVVVELALGDGRADLDPIETTLEDLHTLGEDVVVDEASVNREDAHEQDNVATAKEHLKDFIVLDLGQRLLVVAEEEGDLRKEKKKKIE